VANRRRGARQAGGATAAVAAKPPLLFTVVYVLQALRLVEWAQARVCYRSRRQRRMVPRRMRKEPASGSRNASAWQQRSAAAIASTRFTRR